MPSTEASVHKIMRFVFAILIGISLVSLVMARRVHVADARPAAGKAFTSYDLPMPSVMPAAAYDAN